MRMFVLLLGWLTLFALLALPGNALACPSCADAPAATGTEFEDAVNNQAAYNNSIYVMVGVPYFSFGIVGFLIYRGMKKNDAFRNGRVSEPEAPAGKP
jgi:hypothetical protein